MFLQLLARHMTFAPCRERTQNLPSSGPHAQPNWPCPRGRCHRLVVPRDVVPPVARPAVHRLEAARRVRGLRGPARHRPALHADPSDRDAQRAGRRPAHHCRGRRDRVGQSDPRPGPADDSASARRRSSSASPAALAWSSHILLDWLGADANPPYGIQAFWPFSDTWFISGVDVFPGTQRRNPLSASAMLINLQAAIWETALMGSVAAGVWWISRRFSRTQQRMQPRRLEDSKKS